MPSTDVPPEQFSIGSADWPGLSKLIEECGEVIQVAGKLLATGGDLHHWEGAPLDQRLMEELADLKAAIEFFVQRNSYISGLLVERRAEAKLKQFIGWHSEGRAAAREQENKTKNTEA